MCHGGARVGTVSLSSSNAHSDGREDNGRGMVAGSGPLAPSGYPLGYNTGADMVAYMVA